MQCEMCGCSEDNPCEGGCFWAAPGVCSQCVLGDLFQRTVALPPEAQALVLDALGEAVDRVELELEDADAMAGHMNAAAAAVQSLPRLWRPGDPL